MARQAGHCAAIALANLFQRPLRLAVAIAGTAVPILLLLLQLSLLQAVRIEVTRLYNDFTFDIAIVPSTYQYLYATGSFDRIRLSQARADARVLRTFNLNVEGASWTDKVTKRRSPVILIGVDDDARFVADPDIRAGLARLGRGGFALADAYSDSKFGSLDPGTDVSVNDLSLTLAGQFRLGLFFYADGSVIVNNSNMPQLTGDSARETSIGLIQVVPGADARAVQKSLAALLPPDVRVLLRSELVENEQAFFLSTKPLGVMVLIGMLVAALAGGVALWQVLSAQIRRRINEFATMSAMGFDTVFVLGVGVLETLFLGLLAYLPALLVGGLVLGLIAWTTHLPTALGPGVMFDILLIVLGMCALCAASVAHRIWRADPADLF